MRVRSARVDELELPLVEPFETSFGVERRRRFLVVELSSSSGRTGHGECVAAADPLYSNETIETARWAIATLLLPLVFAMPAADPREFRGRAGRFRGHAMAKAAVEAALWDLAAQDAHRPLAQLLGGRRTRVAVGVSVGIQPTIPVLVRRVGEYLEAGYRRIKLKVRPGWDERPVRAVRRAYPEARLWVDANQAYIPSALPSIRRWATRYEVEQVEQPFPERSISAHARLARGSPFRVCLDESIVDRASLDDALERRALTSLNVKAGRVGGMASAMELARVVHRAGIPAWVGGMLETGIGRAANVALASGSAFTFPADLSASDRYYAEDLVEPPFRLGPDSTLAVPTSPGLGVRIVARAYRQHLRRRLVRRR